jgi:hypothetical protein
MPEDNEPTSRQTWCQRRIASSIRRCVSEGNNRNGPNVMSKSPHPLDSSVPGDDSGDARCLRLPPVLLTGGTFLLVPALSLHLATRWWRSRGSRGVDGDASWAGNEEALGVVFGGGAVLEMRTGGGDTHANG